MHFDMAGPFLVTRHGHKQIITDQSLKDLKPVMEKWETGLCAAVGCYVFARKAAKGFTPHYVGKACKSWIAHEALNPSNREKYNKVLNQNQGTPYIFLIPMRTPGGQLRKAHQGSGGLPALNFLERWLISTALEKNPDLINSKETAFLRNIHVTGILNARPGEATKDSQLLNKVLW